MADNGGDLSTEDLVAFLLGLLPRQGTGMLQSLGVLQALDINLIPQPAAPAERVAVVESLVPSASGPSPPPAPGPPALAMPVKAPASVGGAVTDSGDSWEHLSQASRDVADVASVASGGESAVEVQCSAPGMWGPGTQAGGGWEIVARGAQVPGVAVAVPPRPPRMPPKRPGSGLLLVA